MYTTWRQAYDAQQATKSTYDNEISNPVVTGVVVIDDIPFAVGEVVWLIMADDFYLNDYEENATEYGIKEDGTWCAISDGHCSCYGWEASENQITEYDSLEQLLQADPKASVITKHMPTLRKVFPFLQVNQSINLDEDAVGSAGLRTAIDAVIAERQCQDVKWGQQNHDPQYWTGILMEEVSELAEAINETVFNNGPDERAKGGYTNMRAEAVQVAAVAVAFVEMLDRRFGDKSHAST